ncbi:MAG: hypothetical protein OQJ96_13490 [Flavobacteriales bacterium]|nr:hypothetical protein [Flavobacteriales bacterium]MCW8912890.1 hypothetical protein [Flavobacteriales bacterium]MCW8937239.1 hypothetical protein [Flavobacteriales bacterium]MCW8940092.1 hypothetical protein [Flavobacteriales bacterium]MCW8967800.1 hypothetical protein [Flavobacteriales bacterium]
MLAKKIIELIEQKHGRKIRYPKDCEALAGDISEKTRQTISSSTIKRLMGFVKGTKEVRTYTLDIIATFLEYSCYEHLLGELDYHHPEKPPITKEVIIKNLGKGQKVKLKLGGKESILFSCSGKDELEVLQSKSPSINIGDKIKLDKVLLNYPLYVKQIVRNNEEIEGCIVSKISGVTSIILL